MKTERVPTHIESELLLCGADGTRTRDPMRDRHVF